MRVRDETDGLSVPKTQSICLAVGNDRQIFARSLIFAGCLARSWPTSRRQFDADRQRLHRQQDEGQN